MDEPRQPTLSDTGRTGDLDGFRQVRHLTNHWARGGIPTNYYWYLAFDNPVDLVPLVTRCQTEIDFPYYDLIPLPDLHLTVDKIGSTESVTAEQLRLIEVTARRACEAVRALHYHRRSPRGTSGAVGFSAAPSQPIRRVRDILRNATLTTRPT